MNTSRRLLLIIAALLLPAASFATNVPLPIENTTMNIAFYVQPQILFTENGTPDGQKLAVDYYIRRSRMLVNGDIADKFSYVFQVDNTNFGKFGNFTGRMIVQDAWFGWAPTGIKGGTVVYVDAGIVYYPFSRLTITSAGNQPTVEGHPDLTRGINATA